MAESNQRYSKWGFVRETRDMASGTDKETGLNRTGLEDYIKVIFPEIPEDNWVHDKPIPDSGRRIRPDYRCEDLKLLIEFDGLQHYQQPDCVIRPIPVHFPGAIQSPNEA